MVGKRYDVVLTAVVALLVSAGRTVSGATERIELKDGWWHVANEVKWRGFTFDRMTDWLDDMGRELLSAPEPSRRSTSRAASCRARASRRP